jgi:benzoyl-CoA reductase/2-hydroxyglutaryl-CoA dehydratase subunit BcrC/BadD/HgdB
MMETLEMRGIEIVPFAFPYGRDRDLLRMQMEKMMTRFGVGWSDVEAAWSRLNGIRHKVWEIDRLTWEENRVTSLENHYYQVCCSDLNSDPAAFERDVETFLAEARSRKPLDAEVRLGFIGIPPIFTDLYEYLDSRGARVVFNEVQRQFTMPFETDDLVEQYALYTYPYDVFGRVNDIKRRVAERGIDALIHYTQSFCFRQIQDLIIRR